MNNKTKKIIMAIGSCVMVAGISVAVPMTISSCSSSDSSDSSDGGNYITLNLNQNYMTDVQSEANKLELSVTDVSSASGEPMNLISGVTSLDSKDGTEVVVSEYGIQIKKLEWADDGTMNTSDVNIAYSDDQVDQDTEFVFDSIEGTVDYIGGTPDVITIYSGVIYNTENADGNKSYFNMGQAFFVEVDAENQLIMNKPHIDPLFVTTGVDIESHVIGNYAITTPSGDPVTTDLSYKIKACYYDGEGNIVPISNNFMFIGSELFLKSKIIFDDNGREVIGKIPNGTKILLQVSVSDELGVYLPNATVALFEYNDSEEFNFGTYNKTIRCTQDEAKQRFTVGTFISNANDPSKVTYEISKHSDVENTKPFEISINSDGNQILE